jgi:hypothetical protein
VVKRKIGWG